MKVWLVVRLNRRRHEIRLCKIYPKRLRWNEVAFPITVNVPSSWPGVVTAVELTVPKPPFMGLELAVAVSAWQSEQPAAPTASGKGR